MMILASEWEGDVLKVRADDANAPRARSEDRIACIVSILETSYRDGSGFGP